MMRTRENKIRACEVDGEKVDHKLRDLHRRKIFFPLFIKLEVTNNRMIFKRTHILRPPAVA